MKRSVSRDLRAPAIRQELFELGDLEIVDATKDVREIFNRVNVITIAGGDERQMNSRGTSASIGAGKEKIFSAEDEVLNSSF